jgi:hypothetical protein
MSYINENLMDDEALVLKCRLHPIVLAAPAASVSLLGGCLIASQDSPLIMLAVAGFFIYAAYRLVDRLILFLTSEFGITTKRVLGKTGFLHRKSLDIVLAKVEAIRLTQTIPGRIFDYGDIEVTGTGGTEEILSFIPDPLEFRKTIQEQLSLLEHDVGGERSNTI